MNTALIAIGGNSLIRAGERGTIREQAANIERTAAAVVRIIRSGCTVVITHGNGPQVGAALLRSERASDQAYEQPLDVCVAATQGEIGYLLQRALECALEHEGLRAPVITLLTQVLVEETDPAFEHPTKPIGPFYSRAEAIGKKERFGWDIVEDASRGYRRVVASPRPVAIMESEAIRRCMDAGMVVIALGGGGIPVARRGEAIVGVEAVIDKDRASALLAGQLGVDLLAMSTDTDYVYTGFKTPAQARIESATAEEMETLLARGEFPPGSMGPKIESALRFLREGGRHVLITSPDLLPRGFEGGAGTHIYPAPQRKGAQP